MSKADFVQRFFRSDHLTTTFMLNNKYEAQIQIINEPSEIPITCNLSQL